MDSFYKLFLRKIGIKYLNDSTATSQLIAELTAVCISHVIIDFNHKAF